MTVRHRSTILAAYGLSWLSILAAGPGELSAEEPTTVYLEHPEGRFFEVSEAAGVLRVRRGRVGAPCLAFQASYTTPGRGRENFRRLVEEWRGRGFVTTRPGVPIIEGSVAHELWADEIEDHPVYGRFLDLGWGSGISGRKGLPGRAIEAEQPIVLRAAVEDVRICRVLREPVHRQSGKPLIARHKPHSRCPELVGPEDPTIATEPELVGVARSKDETMDIGMDSRPDQSRGREIADRRPAALDLAAIEGRHPLLIDQDRTTADDQAVLLIGIDRDRMVVIPLAAEERVGDSADRRPLLRRPIQTVEAQEIGFGIVNVLDQGIEH